MTRRHRGDKVRIHDAALKQVQRDRVEVVLQPLAVEVALWIAQTSRPQDGLAGGPLVAEVVHRKADALVLHPGVLVHLVQEDGHERGLPVVAMNDVRPLPGHQEKLERRLAEERKPINIIIGPVQVASIKEPVIRVWLDEEALAPLDKPKPHRAVNRAAIPRHPQVVVRDGEPVDPVVSQTVVLRQHDLHRVPAKLELTTESPNTTSPRPRCVSNGRTLACHHHDKHSPTSASGGGREGDGDRGAGRGRDRH